MLCGSASYVHAVRTMHLALSLTRWLPFLQATQLVCDLDCDATCNHGLLEVMTFVDNHLVIKRPHSQLSILDLTTGQVGTHPGCPHVPAPAAKPAATATNAAERVLLLLLMGTQCWGHIELLTRLAWVQEHMLAEPIPDCPVHVRALSSRRAFITCTGSEAYMWSLKVGTTPCEEPAKP